MFILSYMYGFCIDRVGIISPWISIVVLSIPKAIAAIKGFMVIRSASNDASYESNVTNEYLLWTVIIIWNLS